MDKFDTRKDSVKAGPSNNELLQSLTLPRNWFTDVMSHQGMIWFVFLCLILLTWLAWFITAQVVNSRLRAQFDIQVDDTRIAIEKRLRSQEQALLGGVGLFAASERVDRDEWHAYVHSLNLEKNYPGMQGMGFSQVIQPRDMEKHQQIIRAEGFSTYVVRPPGKREIYTAIIYLEPFDWRNQRAFGFDMFSESNRRAAMERARDTGAAAMSGKVTLVQETKSDMQNGFLIYLPVYRNKAPLGSVEQRRAALLGYVYSPFRVKDLMYGTQSRRDENINFEIYDGMEINPASLMYDSDDHYGLNNAKYKPEFYKTVSLVFAGQSWLLGFSSKPDYATFGERSQPLIVVVAGILLDVMLMILVASMQRQHKRSTELAERLGSVASSSAAHVQAIANTVIDGIITIDELGTIEYINPAVTAFFGYSAEELYGKNIKMLMPEPYHSNHDGYLKAYKDTHLKKIIGIGREVSGLRRDGTSFPLDLAVSAMSFNGRSVYVGILRDVSERVATSEKLIATIHELKERAREMTLLSSFGDMLQTCQDLDEVNKVVRSVLPQMFASCSGVLYVVTQKSQQMQLACQWGVTKSSQAIDQHDCMGMRRGIPYAASGEQTALQCRHFEPRQPQRSLCVPLLAQGTIMGMLSIFQQDGSAQESRMLLDDVQQQEFVVAASKQIAMAIANLTLRMSLEQQSIHDALTGLHNRRFIQEMLPREIQRTMRLENPSLAVLMLDVDHFKKVNDSYSHAAGDRVLVEVARILGLSTRREDLVCRYGGEEFVVALPNMDSKGAVERANRIRNAVKKLRVDHNGITLPTITISIGVAILPEHGTSEEQLLHLADQALYAAKRAGRDRVVLAGQELDSTAADIAV